MEKLIFTPAKDPVEVPCGSEVAVGAVTTSPYFKVAGFACTGEGMAKANTFARRLTAAYNATRHVPIETLETDPLTLDGVEDTFERLKAQNAQLLDALEGLYYLVESQWLVRNTENDHEQNFTMRQIEPLRKLKKAQETIAAATSTEKTETP